MPEDVADALDRLAREIRLCKLCPLHRSRRRAVPGEGDAVLPIMFVGEAPGVDEDRLGKPFIGRAGRRLDELLALVGIDRRDVRVENSVRCFPPKDEHGSATPPASSVTACRRHLDRATALLQPAIVVPLGATALGVFLPLGSGRDPQRPITIGESHGQAYWHDGRWVFPMYHPAWELRSHRPWFARDAMERDIRRLDYLRRADLATRARPWTPQTLALLTQSPRPHGIRNGDDPAAASSTGPDAATGPAMPAQAGFLRTRDGLYISHAGFLEFVGRAAARDSVSGAEPAQAWLALCGLPSDIGAMTPEQVSAALEAARETIVGLRDTASARIRIPIVQKRDGAIATVAWNTDLLHPMFRTASVIDELMRRATGLALTRMNDTSTTGTITAITPAQAIA